MEQRWEIDLWIMSCRVLGRGVEQAALQWLVERARAAGAKELIGTYIPSSKNGLVREHYRNLGFEQIDTTDGTTRWRLAVAGFVPSQVPIDVRYPRGAHTSESARGARHVD